MCPAMGAHHGKNREIETPPTAMRGNHKMTRPNHNQSDDEKPGLEELAHTVRGVSQLLGSMAQASSTPPDLRTGLELLSRMLGKTADNASSLIEDVGINLNSHLGITTSDLALMDFAPLVPAFWRQPGTQDSWLARAQAEFTLWGAVETILGQDDHALENRFNADPDGNLALVEVLEALRARWQDEIKLLEATLLRQAVVVARWEQSGHK